MAQSTSLVGFRDILDSLDPKVLAGTLSAEVLEDILLGDCKSADFDLVNILLVYAIAAVGDPLRESFAQAMHNIDTWQAWESARCEAEVQKKIQQKLLPSDNALGSKLKRTAYRAKVIQYFRRSANWISVVSEQAVEDKLQAKRAESSTVILQAMSDKLSPDSRFREFGVILKASSRGITTAVGIEQHYLFTLAVHEYDDAAQKFQSDIRTIIFSILVEATDIEDTVQISIGFSEQAAHFIHEQWAVEEPKIEKPVIEAGEKILLHKTLHLAVSS